MDLITQVSQLAAAQTAAAAASGDEATGVAERTDEHYANTVLLLHGDGNPGANNVNNPAPEAQYMALSDDGPNDRQVIRFGSNVYGTDFNPFYYNAGVFSNSFNGDNPDYLEVPNSVIDVGYGPITVECFLYIAGTDAFQPVWGLSNGGGGALKINLHDSGDGALTIENTSGGGNFSTATSVRASINKKWVHVAFVRENVSTNGAKIYIDGVLEATGTVSGNLTGWSGNLRIGRNPENYSTALDGFISNFRITHSAVYTSAFTTPTAPFEDPTTHGELAVYFDGSGDYLEAFDNGRLDLGTGDFTIEAWLYLDSAPHDYQMIVASDGGNQYVTLRASSVAVRITSEHAISYGTTPVPNEWFHLAVVRSGSTVTVYIDGTSIGTATDSGDFNLNSGGTFIGAFQGPTHYFDGYISNLRVTKQALYTSTFTPSTSPFTLTSQSATSSNVALLTCNGKTFQDYSNYNHALSRYGNAHISEFGPFGDGYWSNYFDNDGDYITIPDDDSLRLGTEAFTIEAWVYPTWSSPDTNEPIVASGTTGSGTIYLSVQSSSVVRFNHGSASINSTGTISPNQWTHIAVVREGTGTNQTKIYINGVNDGTGTASTDLNSTSGLRIGRNRGGTARYWQGYLSNVRIVKGTALYTSTFTPSTTPLTAVTNTVLLTCQSSRFIDNSAESHSLTAYGDSEISELIPFEYLKRQTKLITCQENRFKDIIDYRHSVTPSGKTKVSTVSPFSNPSYKTANTGAIYLDGTSFVTVDDQAESFKFGTEDYTMEAWVYDLSTDTAQRTIFGRNATGNQSMPYVYKVPSSEVFGLYYSNQTASTTRKIYKGEWTHLALCRENGTSRLFINGELQGSGSDTTNITSPVKLVIGNNGGSSSNLGWNGYIYGVRVEKGRARYTSNASFKPASTQPSLANSANTGVITTNQFSNFFDNAGDYIANTSITPINDYAFGYNDWTIEGWINLNKSASNNIFDPRNSGVQGVYPMIWVNGSSQLSFWRSTANRIVSRTLSVGKWYHFAFVRSGGTTKLYLDGLKEGGDYADTGDYLAQRIIIGMNANGSSYPYYGWLHGLNILNGVAKYTSNTSITYSPVSKIETANTNGSFSRYIPGLNTKIAIPTTGLPTGSAHRTIECWLKVTAFGNQSTQYMIAYGQNSGSKVYSIGLTSGGALRVVGYSNDYSTSVVVPLKTWFHLSVNYDGTYNTIFLNGMMVDRRTFSINTGTHTHLYVNADAAGGSGTYAHQEGIQICDLAVYNVAIRSAVATSGFIPPTSATTVASNNNIVLIGCQSNTDIELTSGEFKGGYDQSALSSETPFDNGYWSVYFDGSDYLTFPSSTNFVPGSGEFCLEFWFKGVSDGWLVGNRSGGYHPIATYLDLSNSRIVVWMSNNGGSWNIINNHYVTGVTSGQWHHFALLRDSSNQIISYLDGSGTTITTSSASFTSAQNFYVGGSPEGGLDMAGHISNLRFVKGSSVYTGSFTPSTTPLTSITDTKILTCQSGAFLDNSTANSGLGYSMTLSGDPRVSRSRPFSTELSRDQVLLACQDKEVQKDNSHLDTKFTKTGDVTRSADNPFDDGFWSADFDGTSDSFTIESTAALQLPDEFTIEFFMKLDTVVVDAQHPSPITFPSNGSYVTQVYVQATNGYVGLYYNGDIVKSANGSIVANRWYHVAVGRDSSNQIALWLDGVRVATATNGFSVGNSSGTFRVGSYSGTGGDVNGKISNLRIVKGTDVYGYSNATITVPTSPLTKISGTSLLTCKSSNFADNSDSLYKITESGANTRPVFPDTFANTIPQQTTLLAGKYRGSIRNVGFLDESSNNTTVVSQNQVTQGSFTPHYPLSGYWSGYFDGSGDNLTTAASSDFTFGTGDFTIEAWARPNGVSGIQVLCDLRYNNNSSTDNISALVMFGATLGCYIGANKTAGTDIPIVANKWQHLCIQRISSTLYFSVDGVMSSTTVGSSENLSNTGSRATIGGNVDQTSVSMYTGYISNLRVVKGSGVYGTSNFTPSTSPFTTTSQGVTASEVSLLTCQSNRFIDNSNSEHSLTVGGNTKIKPFFPFSLTTSYDPYDHGGSAYFDGGDDRLSLPLSNFTNLLGNDFTFECWYYGETSSNANKTLFSQGSGYSPFSVYHYGNGIRYNLSTGGSWTKQDTTTYGTNGYINQWNHVAISRSGSNFAAFLNGTRVDNYTNAITLMTPTQSTHIGARNGNDFDYKGYVSSWRLVIDEAIYDPTQTTLTLPTSPFRNTANTRALLNFTNAGIYDSTAKNNFLIYGDAQISTGAANTKFGTGSIFFDQGESVRAMGSGIPIGTGPFTIEMFAKINNTAHNPSLLRIAGGSFVLQYYGGEFEVGNEPTPSIQVPYTIVPDRWYHVAVTRDESNNLRLFVDGRHMKTATNYTTNFSDADYFLGNLYSTGGTSRTLKGFLDEVRITVGQARYTTANFTPMTAASGNKSPE